MNQVNPEFQTKTSPLFGRSPLAESIFKIAAFWLLLVLAFGCSPSSQDDSDNQARKGSEGFTEHKTESETDHDSTTQHLSNPKPGSLVAVPPPSEELRQEFETKFRYLVEEWIFDSLEAFSAWYHKDWRHGSWMDGSGLMCGIDSTGIPFLIPTCRGGTKLLELDSLAIIAGDSLISSGSLPFPLMRVSTGMWERIRIPATMDNGIMQYIAENADKPIRGYFIGRKGRSGFPIGKKERRIIRDCWTCSQVLKYDWWKTHN